MNRIHTAMPVEEREAIVRSVAIVAGGGWLFGCIVVFVQALLS